MKRLFNLGVSVLIASCIFVPETFADKKKIKIGVSTTLTGGAATYGTDLKNALLFANEKLTNNKYEFVFEDDQCSGKGAVTATNRFVHILKLPYVMGFPCSGAGIPAAAILDRSKTLTIITSASAAELADAGDYIFRTWPSDAFASRALRKYLASQHKKIAVLSEETEFCQGFLKSMIESRVDKLEIVNRSFVSTDLDFRTILLQLRAENVEAIFINVQTEQSYLAAVKQLNDIKWNPEIYGAFFPNSPTFLEKAGKLAEGIKYVDIPSMLDILNEEGVSLYNEFLERYGVRGFEIMFLTNFEGLRALVQAIESGKDEREYLYSTKFNGLFGEWSFDKKGEIQGLPHVMKVIKNGKPELLN